MTAFDTRSRIVIIGAGFAGLAAARRLVKDDVDILMIDRNNFHTFTPLLYQVATCALDPSEIAYPVRSIFRQHENVQFLLGDVVAIDPTAKYIEVRTNGHVRAERYDYLVVAAGTVTNYYNNQAVEEHAFGLKSLQDTVILRNHILKLFEKAAWEADPAIRDAMLTLVVVGGGPTGIETAGALYELYNHVLANEYDGGKTMRARVVLVEAIDRLLQPYPEKLQAAAKRQLESLGVEVMLNKVVDTMGPDHVTLNDGETIRTHTLVWSAGVKTSPIAEMLQVPLARGGRIPVQRTLEVTGLDAVYAAGDITHLPDAEGNLYPQMIPVAQQQGDRAAKNILHRLHGELEKPFQFFDRGIMATIGRRRAVAWPFYKLQLTGFFAWITWLMLHLLWLMGFRNRLNVLVNWIWNYLTYDRSVRIILDHELSTHGTPPTVKGVPAEIDEEPAAVVDMVV